MEPYIRVTIQLRTPAEGLPLLLFGQGVGIYTPFGISLRQFLADLHFSDDYIDNRVQTVFVNGRAVDDVDKVRLQKDMVIALSAAMPGLAGATLRKGGHLAAMRGVISHTGQDQAVGPQDGVVTLKMFNLVAAEMGSRLLTRGVLITKEPCKQFLDLLPATSGQEYQVFINDQKIEPGGYEALDRFAADAWICLQFLAPKSQSG